MESLGKQGPRIEQWSLWDQDTKSIQTMGGLVREGGLGKGRQN